MHPNHKSKPKQAPAVQETTLYSRIAEDIQARIMRGELRPGDQLPSFPSLCQQYGVSNITIRGALRQLTTANLLETRPRSGVFVRAGGHGRKPLDSKKVVAFIATAVQNPFFADIIHGIEGQCHNVGYRLIVANSNNEVAREIKHLQELSQQVAGIIVTPVTGYAHQEEYAALLRLGVPFVFVDRCVAGLSAPLIATDNTCGAYEAIRHLLEIGRKDIIIITGPHATSFDERLSGIRQALSENGLRLLPERVLASACDDEAAAYAVLKNWLRKNPLRKPLGVFALNDVYARGAYVALREAGLQIPGDAAVIGFDDLTAIFLDPPMTAVHQDARLMGDEAAQVLLKMIGESIGGKASENGPEEIRLMPRLIVRNSTDATSEFCPARHLARRGRTSKSHEPQAKSTPARRTRHQNGLHQPGMVKADI